MGRGFFIENCKNVFDVKCGKIFIKIICEIGVVVCGGGGDFNNNLWLCVVMDKGLVLNMFKDVIECVIKKVIGELEGVEYEEICYEGYVFGGVVVIVDCLIDNCVCIVVDVCYVFSKCGGNMGIEGLVFFMFKCVGVFYFVVGVNEEVVIEVVIEVGVDDIVVYFEDGVIDVFIVVDSYYVVKDVMMVVGYILDYVEFIFCVDNDIKVEGDIVLQVKKLLDMFEDLDDVQDVFFNVDFGVDVYV